jgi:hypothetical protein
MKNNTMNFIAARCPQNTVTQSISSNSKETIFEAACIMVAEKKFNGLVSCARAY